MHARTSVLLASLALSPLALLLPRIAAADVPSPELEACGGKATGDACNDGNQNGTCQPGKCSRLDYSKGTPPGSVEFDCVKCIPGPAPAPAAAPATPTAVDAKQPAPAPTPQASGCAIAGDRSGPALLLLLAFAWRRRARRSA